MSMGWQKIYLRFSMVILALVAPSVAFAQEVAKLSGGDKAWIITATALVLLMTAGSQLGVRALGSVAVAAWAVVGSVIIIWIVRVITPLRVSDDDETEGLDVTIHGERGYNF